MSLMDRIRVKTCQTRAVHVERDSGAVATIGAYYPTPRAIQVLEDTAAAFSRGIKDRAWSLIGPYGTGKSAFGVFLHALLGANGEAATAEALSVLSKSSPALAKRFRRHKPMCRVVLTGSPELLSRRLLTKMDAAASAFWQGRPGRKPQVLKRIHEACAARKVVEREVLEMVDGLQDALERIGAGGLLFVIDELGKFLEFEAREEDANIGSTYLLQELAERSYHGRKANLMLFTLQHQAFDMYARRMSEQVQNEWARVQGRFQTVSYIETTEQTLRVLSRAFEHNLTEREQRQIRKRSANSAAELAAANALPVGLSQNVAEELFAACYPVHPIALLALPILCVRFAQNERTLFTYFGGGEPHGFQKAAARLEKVGDWVLPSDVYDYFILSRPPAQAAIGAQRTWAEVLNAVDRAAKEEQKHTDADGENGDGGLVRLVKAVGLLNLTTGSEGVPASEVVLGQLYPTKGAYEEAIAAPVAASILQYRNFSREYRVCQGTDFNIDEQVARERDKLGRIDLARVLTERGETTPIVARRHSIEGGALRTFEIVYADAEHPALPDGRRQTPRVVMFLAERRADQAVFYSAREGAQPSEVWVLHRGGATLRAAIGEVLALERVQCGAEEVASDPVAALEVREHLKAARTTERRAINALFQEPERSKWYWAGEQLSVSDKRSLQASLSAVMDGIYPDSPLVRSELINRDRLSSRAAAARNTLFGCMFDGADQPALGMSGHSLVWTIYHAVFEIGELHGKDEHGRWAFRRPSDADPLSLGPAYGRLDTLFEASEANPVSAQALMDELALPPFGVRHGLSPLLLLHYYLMNRDDVAFYDEFGYAPALTIEKMPRLLARPDLAIFRRFNVQGSRAALVDAYGAALLGGQRRSLNAVGIATPLVRFVFGLDDYSLKTRRVSETAVRVRQAIRASRSAQELVFQDLPAACGLAEDVDPGLLAKTLAGALRELSAVRPALLDEMNVAVGACFGVEAGLDLPELRVAVRSKCEGWSMYQCENELQRFIAAAAATEQTDDEWFDSLLAVLGDGPSRGWVDGVDTIAKAKLAVYAESLRDRQLLQSHEDALSPEQRERVDLVLVGVRKAGGDVRRMVAPVETVPDEQFSECLDAVRRVFAGVEEEHRLPLLAGVLEDSLHPEIAEAAVDG